MFDELRDIRAVLQKFLQPTVLYGAVVVSAVVLVLVGAWYFQTRGQSTIAAYESVDLRPPPDTEPSIQERTIVVAISGAVHFPGVYELVAGSRVVDVIQRAGGFSQGADSVYVAQNINGAEYVLDQQKLYIPFALERAVRSGAVSHQVEESLTQHVSINTATVDQLQELSGIGEKRAETIVAERPYTATDDLVSKGIISESLYDELKSLIKI